MVSVSVLPLTVALFTNQKMEATYLSLNRCIDEEYAAAAKLL